MQCNSYLHYPYFPNRQNKKKRGRPTVHPYIHHIAYTETLRGDNYDVPTLLFVGAPDYLVRRACQIVYGMLVGRVGDIRIRNERACRYANGKCYWRTEVEVYELDEDFMLFSSFVELLCYEMQKLSNCDFRHYRLETFLNL